MYLCMGKSPNHVQIISTLIVTILCSTLMFGCKQQVTDLEGEFTISSRHADMLLGVSLADAYFGDRDHSLRPS